LPDLNTGNLRAEWERLHGAPPSARLSPDMLRRGIGHTLQEAARGGLPAALRRRLASFADGANDNAAGACLAVASPPRLKPGATLLRDWHGQTHAVLVRDGGFDYQGRRYTSLTEIARVITGTHWSGPRFFGLQRAARRLTGRGAVDPADVSEVTDAAAP
jgi:hypothetical protein